MMRSGLITWLTSLAINLVWVLIVFSSLDSHQLMTWFNSDTLYLPSIFRDVFVDNSGLRGWHLNGAPNFFPDMLVFFIFNGIIADFKLAMLAFSVVQYMALLLLLGFLLKTVARDISWHMLAMANLLMLIIFFVTAFTGDFVFTFYILSISYHLGAFIMTVLCLLFTVNFLRSGETKYLRLLMLFGFLAMLSNRLFLVMFVIPSAAVSFFFLLGGYSRKLARFLQTVTIFSVAGIIAFFLISKSGFIYFPASDWKLFNFSNIQGSFNVMTGQHFRYLYLMDFRGITVLLSMISFIAMIIVAVLLARDVFKKKEKEKQIEAFYACFSCFFFVIVLFMPVINGSYVSWAMLRYNIYVLFLALFNYAFIFHYVLYGRRQAKTFVPIVATGISVMMAVYTLYHANRADIGEGLSAMLNHYPDYVECIDEFADSRGLQYGVAGYWYAKMTTMFSRKNVRLYTVHHDMAIWYHVSNRNWYYKNGKGAHASPEFKFVVLNSLDSAAVGISLGEPLEVFSCEEDLKVLEFPEFEFDPVTRRTINSETAENQAFD